MSARWILVYGVVMGAVIVGGVFWGIGKNEDAAGHAATRFAAAVVDNDPAAAPKGAREYIPGVRAYFGAVTAARVIGTLTSAPTRTRTRRGRIPWRTCCSAARADRP